MSSNLEREHLRQQSLRRGWKEAAADIEFEGGVGIADVALISLLGHLVVSPHAFQQLLAGLCTGGGGGHEGAIINAPSKVADIAFEDGDVIADYVVEIIETGFGDDASVVARMPVSRFLAYVSLAVTFHARFVDEELDSWGVLRLIFASWSREAQLKKLSEQHRSKLRHLKSEWTR